MRRTWARSTGVDIEAPAVMGAGAGVIQAMFLKPGNWFRDRRIAEGSRRQGRVALCTLSPSPSPGCARWALCLAGVLRGHQRAHQGPLRRLRLVEGLALALRLAERVRVAARRWGGCWG